MVYGLGVAGFCCTYMAGSTTDPLALAYSNQFSNNELSAVAYSIVYPVTMFMRVLTAQLLILIFA